MGQQRKMANKWNVKMWTEKKKRKRIGKIAFSCVAIQAISEYACACVVCVCSKQQLLKRHPFQNGDNHLELIAENHVDEQRVETGKLK